MPFVKKHIILILLFVIEVALIFALEFSIPNTCDDAFITYRYARNIATGNGFVFNFGERILGTTTPLYTLLLSCGDALGFSIPDFSLVLESLSIAGISLILFFILNQIGGALIGILAVCFYLLPLVDILGARGMEAQFYSLLLLGTIYLWSKRHYIPASALFGLAVLTRIDALILAPALFLHFLFFEARRHKKLLPSALQIAGIFLIITVPWFVFSLFYFGSLTPHTIAAKMLQGQTGWIRFDRFMWEWAFFHKGDFSLHWVVPFAGYILCWMHYRHVFLSLLVWFPLYIFMFCVTGMPHYNWYQAPLLFGISIFNSLAVLGIYRAASSALKNLKPLRHHNKKWGALFTGVVVSLLLWSRIGLFGLYLGLVTAGNTNLGFDKDYTEVGKWLSRSTPANATVSCVEVGIIGYYSERRIVDLMGLVSDIPPEIVLGESLAKRHILVQADYAILYFSDYERSALEDLDSLWRMYKPVKVFSSYHEWYGTTYTAIFQKRATPLSTPPGDYPAPFSQFF